MLPGPATLCRTLGRLDFIRVPCPAARIMAAVVMAVSVGFRVEKRK